MTTFAAENRKVMKKILFIFVLLGGAVVAGAQEMLTLSQCLQRAIDNNLSLKSSRNELNKARYNLSENRAKLLPQINLVASFNDNFEPPVSVTDGSAYGKAYNVTKTLQYNAAAGLQLQMPLYNQTVYTSIGIAKTVNNLNELSYEKAREDLIMQVSRMYYLAQNTEEQLKLVQENIARLKALRDITVAFYDNGMAVEVDVQRVNINLENLQVQYDNARAMLTQQYNTLKYVMDYPAEQQIAVPAADVNEMEKMQYNGPAMNQYELLLLQEKEKLVRQQTKIIKDGYLPSLSLTGSWMYSAYTDKFKNWFHSGESNHWYGSNGVGLSLRVPVFDGFDKRSRIRKGKIDIENARLTYESARKNVETQYMNATNELLNSERNYLKQKDNYRLAENVCGVTTDRYREGIASMTEVLQDEMRVSEAQNNYLTAHYNYQVANLTLMKLTKQLDRLTK